MSEIGSLTSVRRRTGASNTWRTTSPTSFRITDHQTSAGPCQPRDHLGLPARHR